MKFTFADLFAGIGGFHIALHKSGGECVLSAEWDKFARLTYEANFKNISPKIFENGLFVEDVNHIEKIKSLPNIDLIAAGFPCQPFSNAGLKKGFHDTRGTLYHSIISLINLKIKDGYPPKILLLENVKGLLNHDKGNTLKVILSSLEELGYHSNYKILNSKNFGVPQNRERIFIVAWRNKKIKSFNFPDGSKSSNKLGDILEKLTPNQVERYTISDRLWNGHKRRKKEHLRKGNGFGYSLFNENSPYTSTISARYYKDGSEILIQQDDNLNPRKLTPREAARLQGFSDQFVIPVSDTQAYKQFGNSVSIPVVKAVSEEIVRQLL